MESFFSRFRNALVLIAILLAQTIALATQVGRSADESRPDGQRVRLVRLWANALVTPFERAFAGTGRGVRGGWSNYVNLRHVRQQNEELNRKVAQLQLERAALSEDALEGKRLREMMHFQQQYAATTVVAQVVGTSGSDGSRLLTLDKGWHDGLKPGMAVITPDGIVGKLRDVFPGTSQLLLISDPTSGAGVVLQSTRIRAVLRGSAQGRIVITNLTADGRIKPGEAVLTSGGDQVFPRGLPVGTIEKIAPDLEHQPYMAITLKPAADLNRLEEVLIVTGMGATTDASTAQDGAVENPAHAADASGDRLPRLHEGAPEAPLPGDARVAEPPAANSTGLVPKPKAVLHPDRYSPGAAPPAEQMTPGQPKPRGE